MPFGDELNGILIYASQLFKESQKNNLWILCFDRLVLQKELYLDVFLILMVRESSGIYSEMFIVITDTFRVYERSFLS